MRRQLLFVVPALAEPTAFASELGVLPLATSWGAASEELRREGWPAVVFGSDVGGGIVIVAIQLPRSTDASSCELRCTWKGEQKVYDGVELRVVSSDDEQVLRALDVIRSLNPFLS